jgi:Arc/MetJ family transcription regulator
MASPAIYRREFCYPAGMSRATRRKTSFEVDVAKVEAAKDILGTTTLTDTVDAALTEVVKLRQRRALVELLFTPGALALDDPDVMAGAWR